MVAVARAAVAAVPVQPLAARPQDPCCLITDDNILGPYYKAGAPFRTNIRSDVGIGQKLIISGTVYGNGCGTALAGALVDVWQADDWWQL